MKRKISLVILGIVLLWIGWIGYQCFTGTKPAYTLLEKKMDEVGSLDVNTLLRKMTEGYEYAEVEVNRRKYWMGWVVLPADFKNNFLAIHLGKPPTLDVQQDTGRNIRQMDSINVFSYVDYIDVLPFGYYKLGTTWRLTISLTRKE